MGHSRQSGHANTVSLRNFVQSRFNRYVKLARLKPTYHRSQNADTLLRCHAAWQRTWIENGNKDYMITANVQLQPHPHQKLCHVPENMSYGATNDIPVQNPMPVQQPTDAMPWGTPRQMPNGGHWILNRNVICATICADKNYILISKTRFW